MSKFESLKASLKDKWLDYYVNNRIWIERFDCRINFYLPNLPNVVHKRPSSKFIIAIASFLEPELTEYLGPLLDINNGGEEVVRVIGLNFDPDIELIKRQESRKKDQEKLTKLFYTFLKVNKEKYREIIKNLTFIYSLILINIDVKKCIDEINYLISIGEEISDFGNSENFNQIIPMLPPSPLDEYRQLLQIKEQ